ncbi:hypothetical protein L6274_02605, partial [Candidatus Parcubacteria bacterium]|nr:hypothetical protein [Candidatus Parcubacteria bacterium]
MKWLFLINNAQFLPEFLGKIANQLIEEGDKCAVAINSKLAEYERSKFFPKKSKIISKVDWCIKNYNSGRKNFGDLSWRELFIINERFDLYRYDYEKSLKIVSQLYQFFDYIFEKEKPDIVIGEMPAGLFGQIAYSFCQKNNVRFLGILESRLPGRTDVYNLEWTCSKYEKTFQELKKEDLLPKEIEFARDFIEKFISHKVLYSSCYSVKIRFNLLDFTKHYFKRAKESGNVFLKYFLRRNNFKDFDYESESGLRHSLSAPLKTIKRNFKILSQKNAFEKTDPKDKYFFSPLQYEPEASTLVLATYYSNQLATIKNIATTLPLPYKLYLKEHPGSIGTRSNAFYKELKKIPNVVLLSSEESTPAIIAGAEGVITVTSTVGMEAALSGKLVYVLGNVFYSYHPLCRKV